MFESVFEAITALRNEAAAYPDWVRVWMKIMSISFFAALVFGFFKRKALWIFAMMALTALGLIVSKIGWPTVPRSQAGAWIHLILWPTALWGLWHGQNSENGILTKIDWVYTGWKFWVTGLIAISLVLDVREIITML